MGKYVYVCHIAGWFCYNDCDVFKRNEDGCEICECEEQVFSEGCPDEMCMMHCPLGRKKDDNG